MVYTHRPATTIYLTGVSTTITREAKRSDLGMLATPATSLYRQRGEYGTWAMDNGCYKELHPTQGKPFNEAKWFSQLDLAGPAGCAFVTMPDVLRWVPAPEGVKGVAGYVPQGDPIATWERSEPYIDKVRGLGFKVAVVLQDGIEDLPEIWAEILDRCDAVFIGGSDAFKLGAACAKLVAEARAAGLWVHMGRVNSYKRISYANAIGCHSADGTFVGFKPGENEFRMLAWLDKLAAEALKDETEAA